MRTDKEIRQQVEEALDWDPQIGMRDIAVAVREGVVTLAGFVLTWSERAQAEADAKRVTGVLGIANDIEVRLPLVGRKPDPQIARDVIAALQNEMAALCEHIRVRVADGRVTLEGEVEGHYERARVEEIVRRIKGVRSFGNEVVAKPQIVPLEIKRKIADAFKVTAEIDADSIAVDTADEGTIILTGSVSSLAEREAIERAAWSVPGVKRVENRVEVVA
jgi:osmotically-inducible protein OsmY